MSALNQDMVLDCMTDYDNQLALWKWHQGDNQKWNIEKLQNNKFRFLNVLNSKVISSSLVSNVGSLDIKCKQSSKTQQQNWEIVPFYDQHFKQKFVFSLRNCSGKCLDVYEERAKNGQKIIQWNEKKTGKLKQRLNQLWILEPVSFISQRKANYKIFSALEFELVMDVSKDPNNLNEINLCYCHKNDNQKFYIQSWLGKYLIISKDNNYSLQIAQGNSQNQANLIAGPIKRDHSELWDIIPCKNVQNNAKGAFFIRSHCGKYLDCSNGKATDRAKIFQWDYHGNKNQQWYIHKV